jgi:predicted TIM-barrel fold metal-dependent hydrolase
MNSTAKKIIPDRVAKIRSAMTFLASILTISTSYCQNVDELKLKDYRPVSIYKVPVTEILRAKFPVIDAHTHVYARTEAAIEQWLKAMDACGIEKAVILTGATGARFDSLVKVYSRYGNRFELWCGFDYKGYENPGYGPDAVKELERCVRNGAKGVGEVMFKGKGISPGSRTRTIMLPDDPRLGPLYEKCAELNIPVNLHVSEDKWMYEPMDSTNDGLMNAAEWQIKIENGAKTHEEMLSRLENTVRLHPRTKFIAAHLANCCADLSVLGRFLDKYPNLFADVSARYGEIAPIPDFVHDFIEKYQDRLVYGTDMGFGERMYRVTFRILESSDEHFYENGMFSYHWPLYGLAISGPTLAKLYKANFESICGKR